MKQSQQKKKIDAYSASDYAGLRTPHVSFYFGYEKTYCQTHGAGCECEEKEWAFVVMENGRETMRLPASRLAGIDDPAESLLLGIGEWITAQHPEQQ